MSTTTFRKTDWTATSLWAMVAAFGAYFCMYGFRKPFTAGTYEDVTLWGIGFKAILVSSQTLGYALSKWIGIKVIAEVKRSQRALRILVLIGFAELMLLGFGIVPTPWNFIFLFFNGLPLGMVFGMVQGYLEGKRMSEALIAGLCASFILADGVTKSIGATLLQGDTSESWMPFLAGLIFVLPLLLFVWMLSKIPPPSVADIEHRAERTPMNGADRRAFFKKYATGLIAIAMIYLVTTILRSVRADFAPEIWSGLGYAGIPSIFTYSEMYVLLGVVLVNGFSVLIYDNRRAFNTSLLVSGLGFGLVLVALAGLQLQMNGFWFMVLIGLGLYIPYVAVHTTIFERLIAMTRDRGNIGYLMYFVDTIGYMGYVVLMLTKNQLQSKSNFLEFYSQLSLVIAILGILSIGWTAWYFNRKRYAE